MKTINKNPLYTGCIPGGTTVGVVCSEGVILASDKRVVNNGRVVSRTAKKIFEITEHLGAGFAGKVSDLQQLVQSIKLQANLFQLERGHSISVKAAATMMAKFLFDQRRTPWITQAIVGGIDEADPKLYVVDPSGAMFFEKYVAVGSGAEIAIGVLEVDYKQDIPVEAGKTLALNALKSAISRDTRSGDGIDLLVITKDEIQKETVKF